MNGVLLRGATLADGTTVDVRLAGPTIAEVAPAGRLAPLASPHGDGASAAGRAVTDAGEQVHDLAGWLLLPAPAEPHAHLDKALTADIVANPAGDLLGAIAGWEAVCPTLTVADIAARARTAALRLLAAGCTAVRTHVNVGPSAGLRAVEALVGVRAELAAVMDLQLVALVATPTDPGMLAAALDMGVDVVGGCPHLDDDPRRCLDVTVGTAAERGLALDLHMDETLDPGVLWVRDLARAVTGAGIPSVTASHCVSLGMQDAATQALVADELAAAQVHVVTLPQTNLFLQARGVASAAPRGLTAIRALLDAGVTVAGGADNLQDPFNTVGRADPLETAALLVMAAHLAPEAAYAAVSDAPRRALGLPSVTVTPGAPAELLAVRASSVRAAVADAPADRLVFSRGRLVARTVVEQVVIVSPEVAPSVVDA
jgi:cytosine/creatinine deaminase